MAARALLAVAGLLCCYWLLGAWPFLRRAGLPHAIRWGLAALLAFWVGGYLQAFR